MTKRDQFAARCQLISRLLTKFAYCHAFNFVLVGLVIVDLTGRHFPDCGTNRHTFLTNEK